MPWIRNELNKYDYRIIKYIKKYPNITKEKLLKKFKNIQGIEYRLDTLSKKDYEKPQFNSNNGISNYLNISQTYNFPIKHSNYIEQQAIDKISTYIVTDVGRASLQNYEYEKYIRFWDLMLKFWLPLIISIIAILISVYGIFKPINVNVLN